MRFQIIGSRTKLDTNQWRSHAQRQIETAAKWRPADERHYFGRILRHGVCACRIASKTRNALGRHGRWARSGYHRRWPALVKRHTENARVEHRRSDRTLATRRQHRL